RPAVAPAPASGRTTEAAALPPVAEDLGPEEILEVVRTALREDRVELVLQPIVSLPQRRRRFYECFSRLRTPDGAMILPEQYIHLAERAGLVTAIDNMLLFRCVQLVRKIHRRNDELGFFCNISPYTLADVDFFADFVAFLENNRELAGHLVFEFAQADFERWSETGARLLDRLAALGCRFSLDQVTDLDLRPRILAARQVRFIKIEAGVLRARLAEGRGLLRALRRHGIDLIVEKVEEEGNLLELLEYEIDFGQGFLFGEPRLARPAA
ncbi:MAG TPA: EAL domain-containing protein, partial [Kiloniellales bacterium]|nr:EAL domain-containing protein [Kiloniellales bacterium]